MFEEVVKDIFRVRVPFLDIYTTVFVVRTEKGAVLFDTATYPTDMDEYAFPVIEALGVEVKYVFVSHNHRDHAGGLERFLERYPEVCVMSRSEELRQKWPNVWAPEEGDVVLDVLRVVGIPGHTLDCMGLLDTRTGTLLTGDSLQVYGIYGSGKWGANVGRPAMHFEALEKLKGMEIETIVASHDYHPFGYIARGRDEIVRYLDGCREALEGVRSLMRAHPELDDQGVAELYNGTLGLPTLGAHIVKAMRLLDAAP